MQNLYLYINLLSLLGPLALSFDKKVAFWRYWKFLFPAIALMMCVFIPWDIAFTEYGVWGFNPDYLCGFYIFNLPIEEWLFFITIPYACIFIYECIRAYFNIEKFQWVRVIFAILAKALIILSVVFYDQWYTLVNFMGCGLLLALFAFVLKPAYLGNFFTAYLIALFPFIIVNGLLTGSAIPEPIVWYNHDEIIGLRIGTIPIEDTIYALFMLLLTVWGYEWMKSKNKKATKKT